MRLSNESGAYEGGLVRHPRHRNAPWITDFEAELVSVPNAPHDDRADSVSQFLKWAKKHAGRFAYASAPGDSVRQVGQIDHSRGFGVVRANDTLEF